jgi:transcriptional regulator with XRE-family HTH domain
MQDPLLREIAERTRTFSAGTGVSLQKIARLVGVEPSNFSNFVNGKVGLNAASTVKLLQLLNLTRRQVEEKLTAKAVTISHFQEHGRQVAEVIRFDNGDGWVPGRTSEPTSEGIEVKTASNLEDAPDELTRVLAQLNGLHQQAIQIIADYETRQKATPNPSGSTSPARQISRPKNARTAGGFTMSKLLEMEIHHLADTRRFNQPTSSSRMTLDAVPAEWVAMFERTETQQDWDHLLRYCQRMPNHIYFAAVEACQGRDSRSKRLDESRQRAAAFLDSL